MSAQYGWLKVNGSVRHPLAEMHNGHIYVHKKDMAAGQCLVAGDAVTFYLYVDDKGLGAEACKGERTTNTNHAACSWNGKASWSSRQVKPQHQYSASAAPFVPLESASPLWQTEEEETVNLADGVLPSIGSVGHSDGSCKRCAFFPKGRCQNGENCEHCHFDHVGRKRLRTRKPRSLQKMEVPPLPDGEYLPTKETEEEHLEDDELLDVQEVGAAKRQPSKEDEDSHSDNGSIDIATVAPSSSCASDDEGSPKHRPFEASDTESCSSHPDAMWPLDFHQELTTFIHKNSIVAPTMISAIGADEVSAHRALPTAQDFGFSVVDDDCASSAGTDSSGEQSPRSSVSVDLSPISWSSMQRRRRDSDADLSNELSPAEVTRKARALLNKLTHERFESLCSQILALPLSTPEQLAALAAEIFEKATTQDSFRSLYTELCLRLDAHFAEQSGVIGGKTFRKVLVNECQATFDRNLQPADAALFQDLAAEESFELEMKLKTRRLGNMRFIGELMVQRLLAQKLMAPIMLELLHGDEVALESLIAFLTIVAPCFDQKASLHHAHLQDVFATLRRKKNDKQLSSRLHCHLSDLFDSRARGWAARSA